MMDKESKYTISVETEGFEEATEQVATLAEAYDGFPAQVTIRGCNNCTFNIYPTQIKQRTDSKEEE